MKNLILITFLLTTFYCRAQTTKPIDGFLGVKFKSSAEQVIQALKTKGNVVNAGQTATSISFNKVSLGSRIASTIFVHFVNDQAYEVVFIFRPDLESKTIEYYTDLVKDINEAYGAGKPSKTFKEPYKEGDGYEITALKTGNANYETNWYDADNYISVTIESDAVKGLTVRLYYNDGKLHKLHTEQQKAKNKSEF